MPTLLEPAGIAGTPEGVISTQEGEPKTDAAGQPVTGRDAFESQTMGHGERSLWTRSLLDNKRRHLNRYLAVAGKLDIIE